MKLQFDFGHPVIGNDVNFLQSVIVFEKKAWYPNESILQNLRENALWKLRKTFAHSQIFREINRFSTNVHILLDCLLYFFFCIGFGFSHCSITI